MRFPFKLNLGKLNLGKLKPGKLKPGKHALAWIAMSAWLAYLMGALWVMEKDNVKVGTICSVKQNQSIQEGLKNGNQ